MTTLRVIHALVDLLILSCFGWMLFAFHRLRRNASRARIESLHAQLQPHFLFNTLNSIAALTGEDAQAARNMIARLSELLRLSLATMKQPTIPLAQELEIIGRYLDIQRVRFGDLRVEIDVPDDCLDAAVPPFILQPLVENAVKHGAGPIRLVARRGAGELRIEIVNDGAAAAGPIVERAGMSNTRERLRAVYGGEAQFAAARRPDGVMVAALTIPCEAPQERAA